jgi:hypothetical protein
MTSLEGWGSAIELRPRARRETLFAAGEHRQRTGTRPSSRTALVSQEQAREPTGQHRQRGWRACGAVGYGSVLRDVAQLG